jgi:hypothetical protein
VDWHDVDQPISTRKYQGAHTRLLEFATYLADAPRSDRYMKMVPLIAWHDYDMQKDVDMGSAGSVTVALLIIAVVFLLRSFYKRYNRMTERENESND